MTPIKVLILTADAGLGHNSAAKAIAAALRHHDHVICEIHNPLNGEDVPAFIRDQQSDYDKIVLELPDLYKVAYDATNTPITKSVIESVVTVALYDIIRRTVEEKQPDVIVMPYPLYQAPLGAYFTLSGNHIPLITVVTDLATVHRSWFNSVADICVVPTGIVRDIAIESGLESDQVKELGIPVHPDLSVEKDKNTLRKLLGWQMETPTALVVGSNRATDIPAMLRPLNHSRINLQLALVAGGNDELFREYTDTEWHHPAHIYNFVDNLPDMMRAADFVIGKAGGLIVTESLACGLPLSMVDVLPGQEEGNAHYVEEAGAGRHIADPIDLLETVYHWVEDNELSQIAANARAIGRPDAAVDIAALTVELARSNRRSAKLISTDQQGLLRDLLAPFVSGLE